jgi:hypothetical protein
MLGAEIAALLAANGFGSVNTSIFYNEMPPDPDMAIAVLEYFGGEVDEPTLGTGGTQTRLEFPHFQIVVRGVRDDNNGPALRAIRARTLLVAQLNVTLSGVSYKAIDCLGPPFFLDKDENFRRYWVCNFRAWKEPSTS